MIFSIWIHMENKPASVLAQVFVSDDGRWCGVPRLTFNLWPFCGGHVPGIILWGPAPCDPLSVQENTQSTGSTAVHAPQDNHPAGKCQKQLLVGFFWDTVILYVLFDTGHANSACPLRAPYTKAGSAFVHLLTAGVGSRRRGLPISCSAEELEAWGQ